MDSHDVRSEVRPETIRTVGWASKLRLGTREEGADQGFCADLDGSEASKCLPGGGCNWNAPISAGNMGCPAVGGEVLGVVRSLMQRAQNADLRIRVEVDPRAATMAAGPIGTVLFGMLRRAIDAYPRNPVGDETPTEMPEIAVCVRLDGSMLRLHVLDSAPTSDVPSAEIALGLSAATAISLGGSIDISNVPFGPGTLTSAAIPAARLAFQTEDAA